MSVKMDGNLRHRNFPCLCLKAEIYETRPARFPHLKEQIQQYIEAIPNYFL